MCFCACFQALSKMHLRSFCNLHFKFSSLCLQFNHVDPRGCIFFFFLNWVSQVGSMVKNLPANARDTGLIPGSRRSPGEGNGNPLQYACLGNPMDRGARWALVHGAAKSQRQLTEWLNNNTYEFYPTGVDYFWNCFNLHLWNNGKLFSFYTTQIITSLGNKTTAHKIWYSCDLSIMPKTTL